MEYCIGIDSTDLLFEDLFQYFIDAGPEGNLGLFMERLEPFILHGEVTNIPTLVLGRIIGFLLNINRPDIVERIIIHLDPNCIDPQHVNPFCREYNLLTAYIYINTRTNHQSFVNPLKRIFHVIEE
mmetsp:Transcript_25587/g.4285  ORF Transcript_25587/g.4285 Transcript_25587/m.4285 type:complete len:126 (+) Transcript_25587:1096-1473(+)